MATKTTRWEFADATDRGSLSTAGLIVGDVGLQRDTGEEYRWSGSAWVAELFDNRQSPVSTSASPGSPAEGAIALGFGSSAPAIGLILLVVGATSRDFDVELFATAARTRLLYSALGKTTVHIDATPFMLADGGKNLEPGDTVYWRIRSNDVLSDFDLALVARRR